MSEARNIPPDGRAVAAEQIAVLLRGAPDDGVAERIADARSRWPEDLRLILLEGSWLERTGQSEQAEAQYRAALAAHPTNPWPAMRLVELLLTSQRVPAAADIFAAQVWASSIPEAARRSLLARIASGLPDAAAQHAFLSSLLRGDSDDRFVLSRLAALSLRQRNRGEAERLLDAARQLGPLPPESQALSLELLISSTRFAEAYELALSLRAQYPDRIDYTRRAIHAAHLLRRSEELVALFDDALARWPQDWLLVYRYNRCVLPISADRRLFARLAEQAGRMQADDRWMFQYVLACLRHDRTEDAIGIVGRMATDSPVASMALPLRAALACRPASAWRGARGVVNDAEADVQIVRVPQARATAILLVGVTGGLGYLPPTHVEGLLGDWPLNVVYLRDVRSLGFTEGVQGLAPDQAGTIARLRAIVTELGAPAVAVGSSLGGIAAIRTAILIGAPAAVSFAGPIHLGAETTKDVMAGAGHTRSTLYTRLAKADMSLVQMIARSPATHVFHCYGTEYEPDVADAELVRDLPNVTLVPIPGYADHFAIEHMIGDGTFSAVLERAIAVARGEA